MGPPFVPRSYYYCRGSRNRGFWFRHTVVRLAGFSPPTIFARSPTRDGGGSAANPGAFRVVRGLHKDPLDLLECTRNRLPKLSSRHFFTRKMMRSK